MRTHASNDFEFKIRLGLSKQKLLYLNSQPTDSQSGAITPNSQLEWETVTFSHT